MVEIICYKEKINHLKIVLLELELLPPNGKTVHLKANIMGSIKLALLCFEKRILTENCANQINIVHGNAVKYLMQQKN